jgi:hypothetical protein
MKRELLPKGVKNDFRVSKSKKAGLLKNTAARAHAPQGPVCSRDG